MRKPRKRQSRGINTLAGNAVLYARVSSREQEKEGYSIPAQQMLLKTYALDRGLSIVGEYIDVESAKKSGRTSFTEMVSFLRQQTKAGDKRCRTVLVEKTDRLYRNFRDYVTLEELDLEIHMVKEGAILSRDSRSSEKFMHGIKVLMAKNYLDNLSEEVTKGQLEKARQGHIPGKAPIGYINAQEGGRRYIAPDPHYGPLVARLFDLYAQGGWSLQRLALELAKDGLTHPKLGKALKPNILHWILTNPVYYGDFVWDGQQYRGQHQPLVTRELFDRVQEMLTMKSGSGPKHRRHCWAFQGLIHCGHCGSLMTAEIKKGRYVYYHCAGGKRGARCPEKYVREEVLADAFGDALRAIKIDDEVLGWLTTALRESQAEVQSYREAAMAKLQADQKRILGRLDALYVDKLDGAVPLQVYETRYTEWKAELDQIERQLESHLSATHAYHEQGARLLELSQRSVMLYEMQEMAEKRRLLDFVVSNSTWADGKLSVKYREPFDLLAKANAAQTSSGADFTGSAAAHSVWSDFLDDYRTILASPSLALQELLERCA